MAQLCPVRSPTCQLCRCLRLRLGPFRLTTNPELMKQLEVKFGGSRAIWFFGMVITSALMVYLIGGIGLIANLIGFGFPARASFKVRPSHSRPVQIT